MLRYSRRPYVCRQCLARGPGASRALPSTHSPSPPAATSICPRVGSEAAQNRLYLRHVLQKWATTGSLPRPAKLLDQLGEKRHSEKPIEPTKEASIRERLRQWSIANGGDHYNLMPSDMIVTAGITNNLSRTQTTGSSTMDQLDPHGAGNADGQADREEDIGPSARLDTRSPGDLVELRQRSSRISILAIYLGFFGDFNHFYGANGRWMTSKGFPSVFTLSSFASSSELEPVLAKIPRNATAEVVDDLRRNEKGPSREDGSGLINKMNEFRKRSESVSQANLGRLEEIRTLLSNAHDVKYLSLLEIADILLPSSLKADNCFSSYALYAVHTALTRNEIGFKKLGCSGDCRRPDNLFEVFPQYYLKVMNNVVAVVREYTDLSSSRTRPIESHNLGKVALGRFVTQARTAVFNSRLKRSWTTHGILKPSPAVALQKTDWDPLSKDIITFLEWWTSYDLFDPGSRFNSFGALILRALNLYGDHDLDRRIAWTFLQEIGVISPWEIQSRYKVRFPGVTITRGGGLNRETPDHLEKSKRPDIAAGVRKQSAGNAIFCIDAPWTTVMDDGISLEYTDKPDEFWIHIHVADPASTVKPNSDLCNFMELIPENIYLPGHFQAMLPSGLGEDDSRDYGSESLVKQFSLRTGGPALTFSAKVNDAGHVLDYKVEPSTLGDVLYLDPDDVSRFCDEPPPPASATTGYSFAVGKRPQLGPPVPERPMVAAQALSESNKRDLLTLYGLAEAIKQKRLSKGAWPYFFPRQSVSVMFDESSKVEDSSGSVTLFPADPYIKVGKESSTGCSVVANSMVLAGEIAARWCSSRGIPIPYRKDVKSGPSLDAAYAYATKEVYPLIRRGIEPAPRQWQELARHTGGVEISPQPGPYFLLGLDMYAKATSPLRRFADLLVHWQIHAALAYEREAQRRIDPSVDRLDKILPFTAEGLNKTLPLLQMREKMARTVSRGTVDWILIALVRAWRFEDKMPRSLRFTVSARFGEGLLGRLDLFNLNAVLDIAGLGGLRLIRDVRVGDEFEVQLVDINIQSRDILVEAKRYLGHTALGDSCPQQTRRPDLPTDRLDADHAATEPTTMA